MRLILLTEGQFTEIWSKLPPQSRVQTSFPGANIYIQSMDALIIIYSDTTLVDMSDFTDPISIGLLQRKCFDAEESRT